MSKSWTTMSRTLGKHDEHLFIQKKYMVNFLLILCTLFNYAMKTIKKIHDNFFLNTRWTFLNKWWPILNPQRIFLKHMTDIFITRDEHISIHDEHVLHKWWAFYKKKFHLATKCFSTFKKYSRKCKNIIYIILSLS